MTVDEGNGFFVKRILLTGMSGTGKSAVIEELAARGYKAVDADYNGLSETVSVPEDELTGLGPGKDWVWREDRIQDVLSTEDADVLFLGGTSPNQGKFYSQFNHVILLSSPPEVIVERLTTRENNPYGKRPDEIERTLELVKEVEPLLRQDADHEIDTSAPLNEVVDEILQFIGERDTTTQNT